MSETKTVLRKPTGFNDVYHHKPGREKDRTHYCPGCGHGIVHKLLAEALEDFEVTDRTIMISPVGCSVFVYYYFDTGNFQVAHGRAPAVGTAISRAHPDSIVVSYQGDGDLAAIGGNNILQAANRGENIMVVFINNAIYGMTGGQMAPTTLEGQKTTTTPYGRNPKTDGYPMKMCEVISQLYAPTFVARTSLHNSANIRKTRDALRKALRNVDEKKGFSFVEVLSMCPSGWKIQPDKGPEWIEKRMLPEFELGVFRDRSEDAEVIQRPVPVMAPALVKEKLGLTDEKEDFLPRQEVAPGYGSPSVRVSGFGGQGIMVIGQTLATVGMKYGYSVSGLPSYGPEMRGGTANCSVKIQDGVIGAMEATSPDVVIAMNRPSMEKFEKIMVPGGTLIYNSTLIEVEPDRSDIRVFPVPITGIADDLGNTRVQSTVAVGAFAAVTGLFALDDIVGMLPEFFSAKPALVEVNEKAVRAGYRYVKDNF
jgi:2-oxoisovalerate ferredoxin oxidoreductase beta subunit